MCVCACVLSFLANMIDKWSIELIVFSYSALNIEKERDFYLQCTWSFIRLLTDGGTAFDAIHKYTPISDLVIFVNHSISPSTTSAENL